MIAAILIILPLIIYAPTLTYGLVIDDIEWQKRLKTGFRNPLYYLYSHYGLPAPIEHAITLSLHITTVLLLAHVATPIAAMLYSVHPCNHQTSVWLTGRRYSLYNILILTLILTHTLWLLVLILPVFIPWAYDQLYGRRHLPQPPGAAIETLRVCLSKLVGIGHYSTCQYSFIYPDGPSPFLPHTQPCAERYLSLPLLLCCVLASKIPFIWLILPLYVVQTRLLIPMYASIQSFYDHHVRIYPSLKKLDILKRLYPEIKTVP